jgi:hypothetical protein
MESTTTTNSQERVPGLLLIDDKLYNPDDEEKHFLKSLTGIEDAEELRKHVLSVQREAFEVSH